MTNTTVYNQIFECIEFFVNNNNNTKFTYICQPLIWLILNQSLKKKDMKKKTLYYTDQKLHIRTLVYPIHNR